jgi:uncharacterized protein
MEWHDKVIVITGGSSGIGKETAFAVAKRGAIPILCARSTEKLAQIVKELKKFQPKSTYFQLDVSSKDQPFLVLENILEQFGKVDILINNAGFGIFDAFLSAQITDFEMMMEVNYFGLVRCSKAVLPHMLNRQAGHIINVASVAGIIPTAKSSGYTATKHAVLGFTRSLRQELRGSGVLISALCPGPIDTPFFDLADKNGTYVQKVKKFMLKPEKVVNEIIQIIEKKKKEVIIPKYMGWGGKLYHVFPDLADSTLAKFITFK